MADVLYIAGMNRSGSTVLERFLAAHDGVVAIGEAATIWLWGIDDRLCSCRRPVTECEFWTAVRYEAFGPTGLPDRAEATALARYINRTRFIPMVHHRRLRTRRFERDLDVGLPALRRLYDAVAKAAPGRLIVDSSKYPLYGHLLSLIPELNTAFVHLVRDSRAVAHSFGKQRVRPEIHWKRMEMTRAHPAKSALVWDVRFAASAALGAYRRGSSMYLRYEDFAADPDETARRIDDFLLGAGLRRLGGCREDTDGAWYHSIQGNPMRFEDNFAITPDEEWRIMMPGGRKAVVTALTLPFLAAHRLHARRMRRLS